MKNEKKNLKENSNPTNLYTSSNLSSPCGSVEVRKSKNFTLHEIKTNKQTDIDSNVIKAALYWVIQIVASEHIFYRMRMIVGNSE